MTNNLKFFWNGIKANGGKLQPASYDGGPLPARCTAGTITIYAKTYRRFSPEVYEAFSVTNGSDSQTDYFEKDRIRVEPTHPLYAAVKAALVKRESHFEKRFAK